MMFVNPSESSGTKPLGVALSPLTVVWLVSRLVGSGKYSYASEGNWIVRDSQSKLELQLGSERRGVFIVDNIEIGG